MMMSLLQSRAQIKSVPYLQLENTNKAQQLFIDGSAKEEMQLQHKKSIPFIILFMQGRYPAS